MHLVCLGVGKRIIELTFDVGETRSKTSKRKLSEASKFNAEIKKIKVFREFSRRCRNLDLGIIKAQEYRNFILFFFQIIVDCIDDNYPKEKIVWFNLSFIVRACIIPNKEFNHIDKINIKNACKKFYSLFEKCFGTYNCTYSIHVFCHILRIRGDEPLTERSAFKYESFYSEMKHLFHPGTSSPLKQILSNTIMKRKLEYHSCYKPIKYEPVKVPNKGLENNSMIYIFNDCTAEHDFFNIMNVNEDGSFECAKQGRYKYDCTLTPEINWSSVGVYKMGPSNTNTQKRIEISEIHGKVIKVKNLLITCPINVLHEQ